MFFVSRGIHNTQRVITPRGLLQQAQMRSSMGRSSPDRISRMQDVLNTQHSGSDVQPPTAAPLFQRGGYHLGPMIAFDRCVAFLVGVALTTGRALARDTSQCARCLQCAGAALALHARADGAGADAQCTCRGADAAADGRTGGHERHDVGVEAERRRLGALRSTVRTTAPGSSRSQWRW